MILPRFQIWRGPVLINFIFSAITWSWFSSHKEPDFFHFCLSFLAIRTCRFPQSSFWEPYVAGSWSGLQIEGLCLSSGTYTLILVWVRCTLCMIAPEVFPPEKKDSLSLPNYLDINLIAASYSIVFKFDTHNTIKTNQNICACFAFVLELMTIARRSEDASVARPLLQVG